MDKLITKSQHYGKYQETVTSLYVFLFTESHTLRLFNPPTFEFKTQINFKEGCCE